MPVVHLADATWEEIRDLDRERSVAILPTGAIEAHGPHLPLDTDVTIAMAMAEAGAARLAARDLNVLVLPPFAYAPAAFAAAFPGTISISPETLASMVVDVATSLHRAGFGSLAIANAHFDPGQLGSLHAAVDAIRERGLLAVAYPDVTRRPWGGRLTEEFRSGACHAGRYEGSIVLARSPERVRERVMSDLPPNPVSLSNAIAAGLDSFRAAGGPRAYFGYPAEATAAEGEDTIEILGRILEEAVVEVLDPDA